MASIKVPFLLLFDLFVSVSHHSHVRFFWHTLCTVLTICFHSLQGANTSPGHSAQHTKPEGKFNGHDVRFEAMAAPGEDESPNSSLPEENSPYSSLNEVVSHSSVIADLHKITFFLSL